MACIVASMDNTTETATEIEETGSYMDLSFSRAPKKNHDAMAQIGKQYVQWLKKHGVRSEIYHLISSTTSEVPSDGVESIAKTLSIGDDDEEVWVALQFYRDPAHADEVRSKMMQDESVVALIKEFDGLVSQGKNLIIGGFSRLKA
jgi:large subunit ribosomal protein L17